ncbi:hypothetical protein EVAR_66498_1 [Eumeta japonica]|uniref:Uncharacterized protein n=1 Tax=Eumeta variegata TaxID=151549 RepID=A0A4C2AEN7_EUMVA|nr:hypothetical protein EVAR_66498_1 [Eumeta japonica]
MSSGSGCLAGGSGCVCLCASYLYRTSFTRSLTKIYRDHEDEETVGCYIGHRLALVVRDPAVVKDDP